MTQQTAPELVVLVDENDHQIGTALKSEVHQTQTPLHRAFSVFLFNRRGELLLQQRSHVKKTWPLVWSNSCCGHPGVGEERLDAARRRLHAELGMTATMLELVAPYQYQFTRDGVMEHEICPIFVGITDDEPTPNPDEVEATRWIAWKDWLKETREHPENYSEWCIEETRILEKMPRFREMICV